jgi:hypothetical protein
MFGRVVTVLAIAAVAAVCGCSDDGRTAPANAGGPDAVGGGGNATSDGGTTSSSPPSSLGEQRSGEATYYAADGSGACSFDPSPSDLKRGSEECSSLPDCEL